MLFLILICILLHVLIFVAVALIILFNWVVKGTKGEESIVSAGDYPDPVHNFVLLQRLAALLGDFPEVIYFKVMNIFMFSF